MYLKDAFTINFHLVTFITDPKIAILNAILYNVKLRCHPLTNSQAYFRCVNFHCWKQPLCPRFLFRTWELFKEHNFYVYRYMYISKAIEIIPVTKLFFFFFSDSRDMWIFSPFEWLNKNADCPFVTMQYFESVI